MAQLEKFKEKTDQRVELMLKLHLILPNAEKKNPVSREVTEDNYQECVSLLRDSALFDFESLKDHKYVFLWVNLLPKHR